MHLALVSVDVSKSGGVGRYAYYIAKALDPVVFAYRTETDIEHIHIPTIKGPDLIRKNIFPILSTLICQRNRFDIVHSMGVTHLAPHCLTAHTSARRSLKFLEMGDLFSGLSLLRHLYWRFRLFVPALFERWLYRKNLPIISVSNLLKNILIKDYGIKEERISVIYPGVDTEEFRPSLGLREETRKKLGLKGDVVLFVGGQERRKGLSYLISALKGIDVTLLLCGVGVEWLATVRNRLKKVVYIPHSTSTSSLYNASDIFVLPSLFDSFGFPVLEALASGLPVIVSRYAGASEIVNDSSGVVLRNPRSVYEIREAVRSILVDKRRRLYMKECARKTALRYDLTSFKDNLLQFYSNLDSPPRHLPRTYT